MTRTAENLTKPSPEEFELSDAGLRHKPTDSTFIPYPGNPTVGSWRDGTQDNFKKAQKVYSFEEVRQMGNKLWGKFLSQKK